MAAFFKIKKKFTELNFFIASDVFIVLFET